MESLFHNFENFFFFGKAEGLSPGIPTWNESSWRSEWDLKAGLLEFKGRYYTQERNGTHRNELEYTGTRQNDTGMKGNGQEWNRNVSGKSRNDTEIY